MARKRNLTAIMRSTAASPATGTDYDPLEGCHVEDFLSPMASGHFQPKTPLQAACEGPTQDDEQLRHRQLIQGLYGGSSGKREAWKDTTDPGGHTFRRGDILGGFDE